MGDRIAQEFYCNECDGYFLANLDMELTTRVTVICPNCDHRHERTIENGCLKEWSAVNPPGRDEILCLKSTYQKEPYTERMKKFKRGKTGVLRARNGVPLDPDMADRWVAVAAREKGQV